MSKEIRTGVLMLFAMFVAGLIVGACIADWRIKQQAIETGHGMYDAQTGDFVWNGILGVDLTE